MRTKLIEILESKTKMKFYGFPKLIQSIILSSLFKLIRLTQIEKYIDSFKSFKNFDFINEFFDEINFSYYISSIDKLKIPTEGKLVIVSNHPLGALDGLAILKAISEVRKDVKIVANDILMNINNMTDLFINYDVFGKTNQKQSILAIESAILNEEAVIFFPAAEVSRMTFKGIMDGKWKSGALKLAKKLKSPILPVYIQGRNSYLFYLVSIISKNFSTFLLPREIFNKKGKSIKIKIGDPIPFSSFGNDFINFKLQNKVLKKHIYKVGQGKPGILKTEKNIIYPIDVKLIKKELSLSEKLGFTFDGKKIYLVDGNNSINILKEISRLREITYRKVGEGTGKKADIDNFDIYYKHLVLWDSDNLEIVGAYRLGFCREIIELYGVNGIYNSAQFHFAKEIEPILMETLELGRSFIQQKYWKSTALDYLWQGIGAILNSHPEIKYLMGAVSISNSYSELAKALIITYYSKYYKTEIKYADSKNKFHYSKSIEKEVQSILCYNNMELDFKALKHELKDLGFTIPVLLRKYSEICDKDGTMFLDIGVDKDFANSIDYLICLNITHINNNFKERYFKQRSFINMDLVKK